MDSIIATVSRLLSAVSLSTAGDTTKKARASQYGELFTHQVLTPDQIAAAEGSQFTWAAEGTRNTGVALSIATGTTYATTQAILIVANTNAAGGPDVILQSLEINVEAVNTAGVLGNMWHCIDTGNRYSSAGATLVGYNADGNQPTGVLVYQGACVATAASAVARDLAKTNYINGIGAATPGMRIRIKYGAQEGATNITTIPTTVVGDTTFHVPAIVIRPGNSYVLNELQTSRSAAGTGSVFLTAIVR